MLVSDNQNTKSGILRLEYKQSDADQIMCNVVPTFVIIISMAISMINKYKQIKII